MSGDGKDLEARPEEEFPPRTAAATAADRTR
jgi:hypothetical protein